MDLHRTILIQRIILVLGFIAVMFITLCCYKQEVEINCKDLYEENLKLKFGEE